MMLAACGGGASLGSGTTSTGGSSSGSSSGGSSSGTTVPKVTALAVTSNTPSILSDGSTTATITALVTDSNNNLVGGVPVTFSATSGGLAVTQGTTDSSGAATATLSTAGDPTVRQIVVTATVAGLAPKTVPVKVVSGSTGTTVQMGSPAGASFVAGAMGITSTNISAGGSTSLTVALQQSDGTLYNQSATVTFSSNCAAAGLATITSPITTSTGIASATYAAKGCSGSDSIMASATIGSNPLSATGSVTVAPASIGSIVYVSATPTIIALKGSGSTTRPESSTVVFQVLDQSSGPVTGASVSFSLNTAVGGISVSVGPVKSDVNGYVQTTVTAGTVATPVRVTATVLNTTPTISTESSQLSVSTGIPTQDEFSIAVTCPNVEAYNIDGVQVGVTVQLADRFSNPVADGTAVEFNTEGGHIQSQCQTTTTPTESGFCTATWISADPRPVIGSGNRKGRSTVLAYAIGEESFVDLNGNGAFDPGETWTDLPERFRDDNGNGVHDPGEFFYDFNNNGVYDGPDGLFNGVLCDDPAHCDPTKESTGIGVNAVIVMSGSTPDGISPTKGATLAAASIATGLQSYVFSIADANGNPMPAGTTVSATIAGTGLSIATPSSFIYPCTTEPLSYYFTVLVGSGAANGEVGQLTLNITTKGANGTGGVETYLQYSIPVKN
jgi:hypothetical protein